MEERIFSVSELNNAIKQKIDYDPQFTNICVCGEISNYKLYPSGHHYFTLKDQESTLSCVMFKGSAFSLKFKPENGISVLAFGNISVYHRDGKYQLQCSSLIVAGAGDLQLAFEQLKEKLFKEGLFDKSHKKTLPKYPNSICIITSRAGAAVHDIIRILNKRWPVANLYLIPVRVQGEGSAEDIVRALQFANDNKIGDLIILGRGGGSIEDLWCFNEEIVARAIYKSNIPVVSAVGHEPDITISDYVADCRASTPSNAAEISVPDINEILFKLNSYKKYLDPSYFINNLRVDLDRYKDKLNLIFENSFERKKKLFIEQVAALDSLSPLKVLSRGYSVVCKNDLSVVDSSVLNIGDLINIRFNSGSADCVVEKVK